MILRTVILMILATIVCGSSCSKGSDNGRQSATSPAKAETDIPAFDADSAYAFIKSQTDFGPRVPGSPAARKCADWIVEKLTQYGASDINVQQTTVEACNGDQLDIRNISASFNPTATNRILLLAHWDTRPWADRDPDAANHRKPFDGANDGASGVGVILEIARQLSLKTPEKTGVDILFVDAEDYGPHASEPENSSDDAWCLGTQHWVSQPTLDLSRINHAVLLDMVGGKDATFGAEPFSMRNAPSIVKQLWRTAADAGYGDRFIKKYCTPVIDDHIFLISAGVPSIDIIEANNPVTGSFNPTWHTMADNIDNIDPTTLKAVGQTLTAHIYTFE